MNEGECHNLFEQTVCFWNSGFQSSLFESDVLGFHIARRLRVRVL